ncbi:acyltransferase [Rahnella bonaserana]|uniref:acyltransferase n=1 Tax=Rahnella bonaserana TaxID=2816248 RepID=UPI00320A6226
MQLIGIDEFLVKNKFKNTSINHKHHNNKIFLDQRFHDKKLTVNFLGENASLSIGKNCNIQGVITISNNSNVHIGDNFSSTGGVTILARDDCNVSIGNDCMFATSILIRTSDEHSIFDMETGILLNHNKDVSIGNHVWICDNVLVLKGSIIEDGSVVGARSLVSGLIDQNSLAVGSPAKVVKRNIYWSRERASKQ